MLRRCSAQHRACLVPPRMTQRLQPTFLISALHAGAPEASALPPVPPAALPPPRLRAGRRSARRPSYPPHTLSCYVLDGSSDAVALALAVRVCGAFWRLRSLPANHELLRVATTAAGCHHRCPRLYRLCSARRATCGTPLLVALGSARAPAGVCCVSADPRSPSRLDPPRRRAQQADRY